MPKELKKLEPKHLAAIRLRIVGKSNEFIAEELGVKERTLHEWWSMEIVKDEIDRQMETVEKEFATRLTAGAFHGLEALERIISNPPEGISDDIYLKMLEMMLDRNPFTNPEYGNKGGNGGIPGGMVFNFNNLTNEQLREKAREIVEGKAKELGSGSPGGA